MFDIFDTHAHYDDEAFDEDREELLAGLPSKGVRFAVNVGASLEGARKSAAYAASYDYIYSAAGLHPDDIGQLSEESFEEIRSMAKEAKCVAIGEIGLDYHWMVRPREEQKAGFIRFLELAKELDKPINVHSRDSHQDCFDIIKAHHAGTSGGIIHCFSGSAELAKEYVKLGYYIGIGGVATFKNAKTLPEVIRLIPLERIVTETDCPYLAPVPFRGKRNDSSKISYVIEAIAQIRGTDPEETARILFENAMRVYRLKLSFAETGNKA